MQHIATSWVTRTSDCGNYKGNVLMTGYKSGDLAGPVYNRIQSFEGA